jgi:two-component system NtrC family sensor kinase
VVLEAIFEKGPVPMALLGEHDDIVAANAAFACELGYDAAELTGMPFAALHGPACGEPDPTGGLATSLRRKNGEVRPYRLTISRARDLDAGAVAVAFIEDLRLYLEHNAERGRIAAHESRLQRFEAVGRLTGGIAHDFNNMLTVILANAEMLAGSIGRDEGALADLDELRAAARRGTVMVRKLLGYGRRERLVLQPVNIGRLVQELTNHLRQLLPPSVQLTTRAEPTPDVQVDPNAVEQILLNLLTNARDAMPQGGRVSVQTGRATLDAEHARRHGWGDPGEYVCMAVSDTGTGMDDAVMARLFEPFFTTKPPGVGTGLGMAMIYGLVKQHGGFVLVESQPGRGTTVRIYFRPAATAPMEECKATEGTPRGGTETILLAEDEEPIRRTARRVLERFGYKVIAAGDGAEALEIIRRRRQEIDLVLTDVVMPRVGGRALYEAARAEGAKMKFLFASGYTARDLGATGAIDADLPFIHKPWTIADLARRVREVLDR